MKTLVSVSIVPSDFQRSCSFMDCEHAPILIEQRRTITPQGRVCLAHYPVCEEHADTAEYKELKYSKRTFLCQACWLPMNWFNSAPCYEHGKLIGHKHIRCGDRVKREVRL